MYEGLWGYKNNHEGAGPHSMYALIQNTSVCLNKKAFLILFSSIPQEKKEKKKTTNQIPKPPTLLVSAC